MIQINKVTGNSLSPLFLPGDYVVTTKCSLLVKDYQPGDIIVFYHNDHGLMIKEVSSVFPDKLSYLVDGTNPQSVNSETLGPIQRKDIVGRVIFHIKKPRNN
jgi:phage repressor protein C with HTH and peptisase S24 domain